MSDSKLRTMIYALMDTAMNAVEDVIRNNERDRLREQIEAAMHVAETNAVLSDDTTARTISWTQVTTYRSVLAMMDGATPEVIAGQLQPQAVGTVTKVADEEEDWM